MVEKNYQSLILKFSDGEYSEMPMTDKIKRRHILVVVYSIAIVLNMVYGGLSVVAIFYIIKGPNYLPNPINLFIWIQEMIYLPAIICIAVYLNKTGAEKSYTVPYILHVGIVSYDELINSLKGVLTLEEGPDGSYYSFDNRSYSYLCIYNHFDRYQKNEFKKRRRKTTDHSREQCGLPDKDMMSSVRKRLRIYINIFDSLNDEVIKKASTNAYYGTCYAECIVDTYYDLSTGDLYIPSFNSKWYGGSIRYKKAVLYLDKKWSSMIDLIQKHNGDICASN